MTHFSLVPNWGLIWYCMMLVFAILFVYAIITSVIAEPETNNARVRIASFCISLFSLGGITAQLLVYGCVVLVVRESHWILARRFQIFLQSVYATGFMHMNLANISLLCLGVIGYIAAIYWRYKHPQPLSEQLNMPEQ